ncbi:hypothetical protein GCM10022247_21980 [Allokutzneria multivorans]|uniref:HTH lysR-type domain-containing protein n=1 Tax=Allokutzneria multivorans TaxID=1142134 RepID=A0ABP7RR83_9PSEU
MTAAPGPAPLEDRALDRLLDCPVALLDVTFDQLRTLLVVHEKGSALRAARTLGRDQSSVQKQLDTLNRNFQALCGTALVEKRGRGQDFLFTPVGRSAVELTRKALEGGLDAFQQWRHQLGRTLTVGTTRFTLEYLGQAWRHVAEEFRAREVELRIVHVRSKDLWGKLDTGELDLVCGTTIVDPADSGELDRFEVLPWWRQSRPVVLTNLSEEELPGQVVDANRLRRVPMILPSAGMVNDFLRRWYGPEYRAQLTVAAEIEEIHYGTTLLRSRLARGCMVVTQGVGHAAVEGQFGESVPLRVLELDDEARPRLQQFTGVFARKGERAKHTADHPLNLLWAAFEREAPSTLADDPL